MRKNHSQVDLGLNGRGYGPAFAQSQIYKAPKKLQGADLSTQSKSFVGKVEQLKGRPVQQSIEDQYVKGLQDQIQYLELELKLLKEKETSKHGQFDQLEKFFGDGIPINENILAIKNGFNNYKTTLEKQILQVQGEKAERGGLIEDLRNKVESLHTEVREAQKKLREVGKTESSKHHQLLGQQAGLKKQIETEQELVRTMKNQNRKIAETISALHRNKQIEMVISLKNDNHKHSKLATLKQQMIEKDEQLQTLTHQFEKLRLQEEQKTYVVNMQEENIGLKKKIISLEKDMSQLHTKVDEMKMELQAKLKERQKEIQARAEIKSRLDQEKSVLSRENSLTVEEIEKYVKQKQLSILKKTVEKNKKLSKYTSYYSQLLSGVEDSIQQLAEKKPELKSQIAVFSTDVAKLIKCITDEHQRQSKLVSNIVSSEAKDKHLKAAIPDLTQKVKKNTDQSNALVNECDSLTTEIKVKEKQLQLITILKSLSLEQVQISKSMNGTIQDRLVTFIRSWEQLQKSN